MRVVPTVTPAARSLNKGYPRALWWHYVSRLFIVAYLRSTALLFGCKDFFFQS